MGLQELLDRPAGAELLEDGLDSDACALDDGLANHDVGVRSDSLRSHCEHLLA